MAARASSQKSKEDDPPVRQRILDAAFAAFMENGHAQASTLEIATRARVSKRELYSLVGNKQEMLVACIRERAKRLQVPVGVPEPRDREALAHALEQVVILLRHAVAHRVGDIDRGGAGLDRRLDAAAQEIELSACAVLR